MGSTYHSLYYHWVCSTKHRRRLIADHWAPRLYEDLGGTMRGLEAVPLEINGIEDHVHALLALKPTHCIADFSRELKKASSCWAATTHERQFKWQDGYAVFSVSVSALNRVARYIKGQREHHKKISSIDELRVLLKKHGLKYDPKYLE